MAGTIEDRIRELVQPLIESMGLELWGISYRGGSQRARLQIYIESQDGVSADTCADVTRIVSPALDAADLIAPAYTLEISSPGLDRIIFTLEQLKAYVHETLKLELRLPVNGRRRFEGVLNEVLEDGMFILEDKQEGVLEFSWTNVQACRIVPDFSKEKAQHN